MNQTGESRPPSWDEIQGQFENHPRRLDVAKFLLQNGIAVRKGKLYFNEVKVPLAGVARVAKVNRRLVERTVKQIEESSLLRPFFNTLRVRFFMKDMGHLYNLGVIQITAKNPKTSGIISEVTAVLSKRNVSIRHLVADDPDIHPNPRLSMVTYGGLPKSLTDELRKIPDIKSIEVYGAKSD